MNEGYVYILSNKALPGLMKIGYSTDSGQRRRSQLSTTGLPHPFHLVFEIHSHTPDLLERSIHNRLAGYRVNDKREFFRLDETAAMMAVIDGWLYSAGFDSNYFNEWKDHVDNFSPALPAPEPTEEEKAAARVRAREILDGLRAMMNEPQEGAV